ncbi:MAG TPA: hydantoinase/oxoprolinase family protein [Candidatus Limnocylindria bacterium]|nr:hydantoinase/oxoprolinase family protein [Candidatus Limnocylindria bacterium]
MRRRRWPVAAPSHRAPAMIGVDTGGTFTDFVVLQDGRLVALKLPSSPHRPERAILTGLAKLGANAETRVRHGSTVATNALLERKGARVTLVTTAGFEDLIEIGRQDRPQLYALAPSRPPPLVPARRRIGAAERVGPRGERWHSLTPAEVRRVVKAVRRTRPAAIAIGLLHAYADPAHERRLERALSRSGAPITRSSALCPEYREYERFSTTVVNAYLLPRVRRYLRSLAQATRARLEIVLSHGGTASASEAALEPVRQLLSGPAAGLRAARAVARTCGHRETLTLDVGGTSTDCAYIAGELPRRRAREIAGFPVLLPLLDVHTVGAGGGSIARIDPGGLLRVGPESAGAEPGPACYGRGGPATVTDALLVLGRLPGEALAGGALPLDRGAAERVLATLARGLGTDRLGAAEGVVVLAEAQIEAALRKVSVERGHDPGGAALVAFGGAGGLHACPVAEAIGCRAVLAPRHAGVLSALGAWLGGSRRERSRSVLLEAGDGAGLGRVFADLERRVRGEFPAAERGEVRLERWAEVRYRGQAHELSVSCPRSSTGLARRFHVAHARRYGFAAPSLPVEVVTVEVRGALPDRRLPRLAITGRSIARSGWRQPVRMTGRWRAASVWERETLRPGDRLRGPALVAEEGATLWVPPGWRGQVHASGTLVLALAGAR